MTGTLGDMSPDSRGDKIGAPSFRRGPMSPVPCLRMKKECWPDDTAAIPELPAERQRDYRNNTMRNRRREKFSFWRVT